MNQGATVVGFGFEFFAVLLGGLLVVALIIVWVAGNVLSGGNGGSVDRANLWHAHLAERAA